MAAPRVPVPSTGEAVEGPPEGEATAVIGEFTHFVWGATADMAAFDRVRAAFNADRDRRSQEERDGITASFNALLDADASRTLVTRAIVFKLPAPK